MYGGKRLTRNDGKDVYKRQIYVCVCVCMQREREIEGVESDKEGGDIQRERVTNINHRQPDRDYLYMCFLKKES